MRVNKSQNTPPQAQKILTSLGLKQIYNVVFLKSTPELAKKLALVQDFLAWGVPSKKTVTDLVRKRGFLKAKDGSKAPITDNIMIEELMGEQGVICVEDLIEAMYKPDESFMEIIKHLWAFQLASQREATEGMIEHDAAKKLVKKNQMKVSKGGIIGNLEEKINELVVHLI